MATSKVARSLEFTNALLTGVVADNVRILAKAWFMAFSATKRCGDRRVAAEDKSENDGRPKR
jgi:hypothetical protein